MRWIALVFVLSAGLARSEGVLEEKVISAGAGFRVVRLAPQRVQVVWKDRNGRIYRSFDRVQAAFGEQGKTVNFIMNAGIFEPGGIPSGLHIEGGKMQRPINLADAPGNFFFKPNGVCAFSEGKASVTGCRGWQPSGKETWAFQSGPMLLIDGKRHPAFREGSVSKLPRNGVGVDGKNQLVMAITDRGQLVNLWDFAGLFLQLGCQNALFLDGVISQMAVNPDKPAKSNQFGAMFVVAE